MQNLATTGHIDISRELAHAVVQCVVREMSNETLMSLLQFNINRDRLELQMRLQLIALIIDRQLTVNSALKSRFMIAISLLSDFFGKSFGYKQLAIIKDLNNQIADTDTVTLPYSMWPVANADLPSCPPAMLSASAQFKKIYVEKHKKHKLDTFIPLLGSVQLAYNKTHSFTVSGIVASLLL